MERDEKLNKKKWPQFVKDAKKILDSADCPLTHMAKVNDEWEDVDGYCADKEAVHFNGKGENEHETMMVRLVQEKQEWEKKDKRAFSFCKTAYKPYDKYVTAIALLTSIHFGDQIENSSDGDQSDWEAGKKVLENALGVKTEWSDDFAVSVVKPKEREETKGTPSYTKE
jgi:hypothetical protein